jgi:hypothetical protein
LKANVAQCKTNKPSIFPLPPFQVLLHHGIGYAKGEQRNPHVLADGGKVG